MTLNTTYPDDGIERVGMDASEVYDLRLGDDDGSASASVYGSVTILSSAPPSPPRSRNNGQNNRGTNTDVPVVPPSMSLSLNPSMIDSSVLLPPGAGALSQSSSLTKSNISSSDLSSIGTSYSHPDFEPSVFVSIGRSLALASVSSGSTTSSDDDESSCEVSKPSPIMVGSTAKAKGEGTKWWDRLQTDEDWDAFRTNANSYLNELIANEMKEMKCSVDKATNKEGETYQNQSFLQWIHGIYESINASISGIASSNDKSAKTLYFASLIKEIAEIKQQMEELPPMPPTLPKELSLGNLPRESRDMLLKYREDLNSWREKVMPQQEELSIKYVQCQENLLAMIINTEEELFYRNQCKDDNLGVINDDGYIEVLKKKSPAWDDVNETLVVSQSKCQLATLGAALFAALTAGAGIFLTMQSKRR